MSHKDNPTQASSETTPATSQMRHVESGRLRGYLLVFIAGCLWGTIGLFVTNLDTYQTPTTTIAFMRLTSAAILLIPIMLVMGGPRMFRIDMKGLLVCLALGLVGQALFNLSYTTAIGEVGMATGAILLYTAPVFVCIMSRIFFHEHIGKVKLIALAINIVGCILTVTGGDFTSLGMSPFGILAGIGAGFFYASMTVISTAALKNYNPMTVLFYGFIFGALILLPFARPWETIPASAGLPFFAVAVGYGLVTGAGAYAFYMRGLSHDLETSKVPVIASVETVVAAFCGIAILGESWSAAKLVGIICVLGSIVIMNLVKPKTDADDKVMNIAAQTPQKDETNN